MEGGKFLGLLQTVALHHQLVGRHHVTLLVRLGVRVRVGVMVSGQWSGLGSVVRVRVRVRARLNVGVRVRVRVRFGLGLANLCELALDQLA